MYKEFCNWYASTIDERYELMKQKKSNQKKKKNLRKKIKKLEYENNPKAEFYINLLKTIEQEEVPDKFEFEKLSISVPLAKDYLDMLNNPQLKKYRELEWEQFSI